MDIRFGDKVQYLKSKRPFVVIDVDQESETELKYRIGRGDEVLWVYEEEITSFEEEEFDEE